MPVQFKGEQFKCGDVHGAPMTKKPAHMTNRRFQWGKRVATERTAGNGPREITVEAWLNDSSFTTFEQIDDYLTTLDRMIGQHGLLSVTFNSETIVYDQCTFEGAERQDRCRPDPSGVINGTMNSYWCQVVLKFTQLESF